MDIHDILDSLNPAQHDAVCNEAPSLLVLAGAGSGKTRVLTHRIAWLVQNGLASSYSVLAVTFTNKAAHEMRSRIEHLLQIPANSLWIGTFHSIAHRLLRSHWQQAHLNRDFQILDSDDQQRLVKRAIRELDLNEERWPAKQLQWFINKQKDEALRPADIDPANDHFLQTAVRVYQHYEDLCRQLGVVDFAELLLRADELWADHPDILQHYQRRFTHLLVDEFQDTNHIQYRWLRRLAGNTLSVTAVGDDDQSIYGWRGARVENIHQFQHDFPGCEVVRLEQNYRSTGNILQAANAVIANNSGRMGKKLWTEDSDGTPLQIYTAFNEQEEARYIVEQAQRWIETGGSYSQIAVLYRSNAQSRVLEEAFLRQQIPYRIYGGFRFFERAEIKDALAYLRLTINQDDDNSMERVINQPPRGVGGKTLEKIREHARNQQISLWQAVTDLTTQNGLPSRSNSSLQQFQQLIRAISEQAADLPMGKIVEKVTSQSGLIDYFKQEKGEKGRSRIENLEELATAASQFCAEDETISPLQQFLDHAALEAGEMQAGEWDEYVQLMTLHSAKGLEFPLVVIAGMEEGLFPHQMSAEDATQLEEERRLCYVGMTRARQQLLFTHAESRRLYGQEKYNRPSRFIREIPQELLQEIRLSGSVSRPVFHKNTPIASTYTATNSDSDLRVGQRVMHHKFGEGTVLQLEGEGARTRVQVNFRGAGSKWLIVQMAKLSPL